LNRRRNRAGGRCSSLWSVEGRRYRPPGDDRRGPNRRRIANSS
jgi:hypothetical protein